MSRLAEARDRWKDCQRISDIARRCGFDVTPEKVNHRYLEWRRWADGRMATGYLMRTVGVKRLPGRENK